MRVAYETLEHLNIEQLMIERLAECWRCEATKLPKSYVVDWALRSVGGRTTRAFVECKDRSSYAWEFFERNGGVILSAKKWAAAFELSKTTRVPFVFVIQVKGGELWYHRPEGENWENDGVVVGGRADRDDWQDTEPCVLLQQHRFAPVTRAAEALEIHADMIRWS